MLDLDQGGSLAETHAGKPGLPRGRSRLPAPAVQASQHERLLRATVAAVFQKGYPAVTVADIVRQAKVSRAAFYVHFRSREDCFLAASRRGGELLVGQVVDGGRAVPAEQPDEEVLRAGCRAFLRFLADEPAFARVFYIDMPAAGPAAVDQLQTAYLAFADINARWHRRARGRHPGWPTVPDQAYQALVGATAELVRGYVTAGTTEALPELEDTLVALYLAVMAGLPWPSGPGRLDPTAGTERGLVPPPAAPHRPLITAGELPGRFSDMGDRTPAKRVTTVLWDIDGTLVRTGGVAALAFLDAVTEVTGVRPEPKHLDFGGRLDPEIAGLLLAAAGADAASAARVMEVLQQLVAERLADLRAQTSTFPGIDALVARLAADGIRQTVVTGNLPAIARHKLEAGLLVPPIELDFGGYGDSAPDRAAVARFALGRLAAAGWQPDPDEVWIVGDTPRDVACAQAVGVRCALVATGRKTVAELSGLGADIVLPDLSDPGPLLRLWRL